VTLSDLLLFRDKSGPWATEGRSSYVLRFHSLDEGAGSFGDRGPFVSFRVPSLYSLNLYLDFAVVSFTFVFEFVS
jgi:hypothetical protein